MERKALGQRIRSARDAAGITQSEAARRTGTDARRFTDWELGRHTPDHRYWPALANALGIPLEQLFLPDGWIALPTPALRPETVALMLASAEGFEATYELVCKRIREAMEQVKPLEPVPPGRRRRSREDVILKGHKPPAKGRGKG